MTVPSLAGRPLRRPRALLRDLGQRLADRLAGFDEALSRHPRLMDWMRLPPIRFVARRRAGALFDLCAGFVYAQVLAACVELDLFGVLSGGARTDGEIAARLSLPLEAAQRLLQSAVALRLVRRRVDGRYRLGPLGAAVAADPGIAAMVAHHGRLYADLADPVAFLRRPPGSGALAAFWPYEAADAKDRDRIERYSALMAASQAMVARQVLAAYDMGSDRRLLDIGGGTGAFLRAVAVRHPRLQLALFDLPPVAALAVGAFADAGIACDVSAGDCRTDALPTGADLVTLVRVLHDHDDATVSHILGNVNRHLEPGGTVLIAEPMAGVAGAERAAEGYFPFYLRAMGRGRTRRPDELGDMLRSAGFTAVESRPTSLPLVASVLVARKPPVDPTAAQSSPRSVGV